MIADVPWCSWPWVSCRMKQHFTTFFRYMHIRRTLNACQRSTHRVSPCQEEEQLRQLSEVASNPNLKNYKNWSKIYGNSETMKSSPKSCPTWDIRWYWDTLSPSIGIYRPNLSLGVILQYNIFNGFVVWSLASLASPFRCPSSNYAPNSVEASRQSSAAIYCIMGMGRVYQQGKAS